MGTVSIRLDIVIIVFVRKRFCDDIAVVWIPTTPRTCLSPIKRIRLQVSVKRRRSWIELSAWFCPPKHDRQSCQKHPEGRCVHDCTVPVGERLINDLASLAFSSVPEVSWNMKGGHQRMIRVDLTFHLGRKR